tara:strand:- start:349 stop:534 length:186 start_codon:yes stop_codon:yes gene_type:complete
MKGTENIPKRLPKWNERYPCPTSVTLYMSGLAMRRMSKKFELPPEPDWAKIIKDYRAAQGT